MSDVTTQPDAVQPSLACISCDYSLAGLPQNGKCPECGLLVEHSRRGTELLRFADGEWLRGVEFGGRVLLWAARLLIVALCTFVLGLFVLVVLLQSALWNLVFAAAMACAAIGIVLQTVGLFFMGRTLGGERFVDPRVRAVCRVTAAAFACVIGWDILPHSQTLDPWVDFALGVLSSSITLALLISMLHLLRSLRSRTREWEHDEPSAFKECWLAYLVAACAAVSWAAAAARGPTGLASSSLPALMPLAHLWWYDSIRRTSHGLTHELREHDKRRARGNPIETAVRGPGA